METRDYSVYTGHTSLSQYREFLVSFSEHWTTCQIVKFRIFFCGTKQAYIGIKSSAWLTGRSPESLFGPHARTFTALAKCPIPQKRWTGAWDTFTTADTLRHFARHL